MLKSFLYRARSEGGISAPLEVTRGRVNGWPQRPERQSRKGHSDKHDAKQGARSGREQLPARSKTTERGASSFINQTLREQDRYMSGAEWRSTGQ